MDANPAFMGTVVAINEQSMVINSAKVNDFQSQNGVSSTQMGTPVSVFDLVLGLAFAWVSDTNTGYTVRSRYAWAVPDFSFYIHMGV